jgi:hypothetical protein
MGIGYFYGFSTLFVYFMELLHLEKGSKFKGDSYSLFHHLTLFKSA